MCAFASGSYSDLNIKDGEGGGGVSASLPGPSLLHHIISNQPQKFPAARPHSWSDLSVISTDKLRETVIRGISQAVFV